MVERKVWRCFDSCQAKHLPVIYHFAHAQQADLLRQAGATTNIILGSIHCLPAQSPSFSIAASTRGMSCINWTFRLKSYTRVVSSSWMSLEATLKRQVPEIHMNKRVLRYGICPLQLTFIFNFRYCTAVSGECPCAWPRRGRREGYRDHDHRDPSQVADTGRICHDALR